jgi:hypothetical protein
VVLRGVTLEHVDAARGLLRGRPVGVEVELATAETEALDLELLGVLRRRDPEGVGLGRVGGLVAGRGDARVDEHDAAVALGQRVVDDALRGVVVESLVQESRQVDLLAVDLRVGGRTAALERKRSRRRTG